MKKVYILIGTFIAAMNLNAQVGVGTTSPNSTLDVRGSISTAYRSFTASTAAGSTDNVLVFTGSSAATATLPDATTCAGRSYVIKNASTTGPTPALTIATTSSQTIDGSTTYLLTGANTAVTVVSNGTNWNISAQGSPDGTGWTLDGNSVTSERKIGTTSAYDLPFITNNIEKMRLTSDGNLGIGTSTFDATAPEKVLIDAGITDSYNLLIAKGERNGYLQFNITNNSTGGQASTDIVATANNGTETTNYVNLGINGGGYNSASNILSGANNGYLYSAGQDFIIGNSSASKQLIFFTGGISTINERMRITSTGNVGIGTTSPADKLSVGGIVAPATDNLYTLGKAGARWSAVYAVNGTIQTSDSRLKTNILPLNYGLSTVMNMVPVRYNWKTDPGGENKIGLLAQEVRKLVPEVVTGDESKENLGMNYAELVPVLINAIKELKNELDSVKKEMEALKKK